MFKTGKIVGVALVVLMASGCAAGVAQGAPVEVTSAPVQTAAPTVEPSAMPTPEAPAEPVPAPITMEPVAPDERTDAQKAGFADDNEWYLVSLKSSWTGELPTDEQLLAAGALACEAFEGGAMREDITVVYGEGDAGFYNNENTVGQATNRLCPVER